MKYFVISKIDHELFQKFLDFINQNDEEDWVFILDTVGGRSNLADIIILVINRRFGRVRIICNDAYSAGFDILYHTKCKKTLSRMAKGMCHIGHVEMSMNSDGKPTYNEDACIMENWRCQPRSELYFNNFLTKEELVEVKKGEDVFLSLKRLIEIFPDATVMT